MLQQTGAITSMAKELGVDEKTAMTAAGALLPAIVAGMGRTATGGTETPDPLGGLGSLAGAILGSGGGAQMLDAVLGNDPTPTAAGNNILGSIFGGDDVNTHSTHALFLHASRISFRAAAPSVVAAAVSLQHHPATCRQPRSAESRQTRTS